MTKGDRLAQDNILNDEFQDALENDYSLGGGLGSKELRLEYLLDKKQVAGLDKLEKYELQELLNGGLYE